MTKVSKNRKFTEWRCYIKVDQIEPSCVLRSLWNLTSHSELFTRHDRLSMFVCDFLLYRLWRYFPHQSNTARGITRMVRSTKLVKFFRLYLYLFETTTHREVNKMQFQLKLYHTNLYKVRGHTHNLNKS